MKYLFIFYPLLYTVVLIIGLMNYNKIRSNLYLRLFLIFIAYSILTEILGLIVGIYFVWSSLQNNYIGFKSNNGKLFNNWIY